jgi:pimeloyl-ACP methyl ester carboxylesterase
MSTLTSKDGTRIAFDRVGHGPSLILVDGAMCSRAMGPMPQLLPLLTSHFTVTCYDRRGRNESTNTLPYSPEREVEDLDALIQNAGGSSFVYGISSGAALALLAAAKGLSIPKLAIYEPPFCPNNNGSTYAESLTHVESLLSDQRRTEALKYFLRDMIGVPGFIAAIMSILPMWSKLKSVALTLPYDIAILSQFDREPGLLSKVRIPTIVMGGTKSPAKLRDAVANTAKPIPNAQLRMLTGQTHNVSAKAIAPILIEYFADRIPQRDAA